MTPASDDSPRLENKSAPRKYQPSPRAFVVGAGLCFQFVGACMFFGALAVWLLTLWLIPHRADALTEPTPFSSPERRTELLLTLTLLASLVGGLLYLVVGLGLQGERRESGVVAMTSSGLMTVVFVGAAGALVFMADTMLLAGIPILLAGVSVILHLLGRHSAAMLKKHPPPPDLSRASPEFLEELRRKEADRLKEYDDPRGP